MYSNKILRKVPGDYYEFDDLTMKDSEAILPGMLVQIDSTPEVLKHATAQDNWEGLVAFVSNDGNKGIDDAYADNEKVHVFAPPSGSVVRLILDLGENVARGAILATASAGEVQAHIEYVDTDGTGVPVIPEAAVVGMAIEAVDATSAALPINVLIR